MDEQLTQSTEVNSHRKGECSDNNDSQYDGVNEKTGMDPDKSMPGNIGTHIEGSMSLADQRETLSKMHDVSQMHAKEGDKLYVIPSSWFDKFLNPDIKEEAALGPINTSSICRDYDNFILADYNSNPYLSVPQDIYEKLMEWYGLAPGSKTLETVLIKDEQDQLVPEYDRCYVRIHLLKNWTGAQQQRVTPGARKPLFFTISKLGTLKMVMQKCLEIVGDHEPDLDLRMNQFRMWQVEGPQNFGQSSLSSLPYAVDAMTFAKLPVKHRLRPESFEKIVKDLETSVLDLVAEYKSSRSGAHWPSSHFYYNKLQPPKGTVGLSNLGNSCYMNSALQCLVHIPELKDYFLYGNVEREINTSNPLGYSGHIARNFASLIKSLFDEQSPTILSFSPRTFKSTLGLHNPMFAGYLQQDSQEFLAFLLDGLHEDLNRIVDKPFVEKPELSADDDVNDSRIISALAKETKEKHKLRNDSVINDLFTGLYKSTLTCPVCNKVSVTFDPFSDLTLPLPVDSFWNTKVLIFPQNSPPCILEVELSKGSTYQDLKCYVAKAANMNSESLIGAEVFNHAFYNNYESATSNSNYLPINDLASEGDTIVFYEIPRHENVTIFPVLNTKIEKGFRSPRMFGYPFFVALDKDDLDCYGSIRDQLEKHYANLSGDFASFSKLAQSRGSVECPSELLKKKYPNVDFSHYKKDFENTSFDHPMDHLFSIKILNGRSGMIQPPSSVVEPSEIWVPDPRVDLNATTEITTLMNNLTKDIYDHPNLMNQKDEIEEYFMLMNQDQVSDKIDSSPSHMDVDTENGAIENTQSCADLPLGATGEDSACNKLDSVRPILIDHGQAIICQWDNDAAFTVFSNEFEFSWDRPAELRNSELEAVKDQRNKQTQKIITIEDCLDLFSKPEILGTADSWFCPSCREHRQATKQIQLWDTPQVLIMHLKRFENRHSFSDKITDVITFPISGLDMSGHLACKKDNGQDVYDLVAVDNHYGGLGGGHYTAYAKNSEDNKWYYFDDSRVTETDPERSVSEAAYLLFYRRRVQSSTTETAKLQEQLEFWRNEHKLTTQKFNDQQVEFYQENPSDSGEEEQEAEDTADVQKAGACTGITHSVASLEVGNSPLDSSPEENDRRRKLRLLHKNYRSALPNSYDLSSSATSSDISDAGEGLLVQSDEPSSPNL
ncbi:LAME_0G03400g1_1 [Lachancea meyersii CBS 8951]|uniref:ubiquitinyl hydrolase 1 n=1 Tax=Lachancea meyersii CBS 8951 TaxID=1266667 RepID=A0A1G4K6M6_9SACH|nr:LAME_0G03400g1_1 [Lachancea meyersii CBS 8951]